MAIHYFMKMSTLQCLEKQLWRAAVLSYSQNTVLHLIPSCLSIPQRRFYRKFSRIPHEIRPAPQDKGKMLMGEYMDKTASTVNEDVFREAKMIARMTQTQAEKLSKTNFSSAKFQNADLSSDQEDIAISKDLSQDNEAPLRRNYQKSTEYGIDDDKISSDRQPIFVHPDAIISKALKAIRSEPFSSAFGKYRTLLSQCTTTKLREENDLVLLEGPKLVREAFLSGLQPVAVFQSRQKLLLDMMPQQMSLQEKVQRIQTLKTFQTPYKKLATWSSVVKGQGLLGVFRLSETANAPRLRLNEGQSSQVAPVTPVTIVLDGVREPGNLGAILRTVAAIGAHRVVLMKGCCDPWEGKALRAGCGAHFSLHITRNVTWDAVYGYVPCYPDVYLADVCNSDREAMRVVQGDEGYEDEYVEEDQQGGQQTNEVEGQRQATRSRDEGLSKHQPERRSKFFNKDTSTLDGEEGDDAVDKTGVAVAKDEEGNEILIDNTFNDEEHVQEFSNASLPTKYYNEHVYYPPNLKRSEAPSVVLVIGSETGLSNHAKKFAVDNFGKQVSVPLHSGIDSLNTSVASGVILYELWNQARRQRPAVVEAAAVEQ